MLRRDWSVSAVTAGFLAVLISYAGPLLIFFQAGRAAGAGPELMASWVWAISVGAAVSGMALSWLLKVPVITAWSAPGTVLLALAPGLARAAAVAVGGVDWSSLRPEVTRPVFTRPREVGPRP